MSSFIRISDVMTPLPAPVDVQQPLSVARQRMQELGVRHLPVLDGGRLVGILSSRDIDLAVGLGSDLERTSAGVAMTAGPYVVGPDERLDAVVASMSEQKLGSVLVVEKERVVGLFTTIDALHLLSSVLRYQPAPSKRAALPIEVRARLEKERRLIEQTAARTKKLAEAALREEATATEALPRLAQETYQEVLRYMDVMDELLVPALASSAVSGTIRAEMLLQRHREQRRQIHMARTWLEQSDFEHLANSLVRLCDKLIEESNEYDADIEHALPSTS